MGARSLRGQKRSFGRVLPFSTDAIPTLLLVRGVFATRGPALDRRLRWWGTQQFNIREVMAVVIMAIVTPVAPASAAAVATATALVTRVVVPGVPLVPLAQRGGALRVTAARLAS